MIKTTLHYILQNKKFPIKKINSTSKWHQKIEKKESQFSNFEKFYNRLRNIKKFDQPSQNSISSIMIIKNQNNFKTSFKWWTDFFEDAFKKFFSYAIYATTMSHINHSDVYKNIGIFGGFFQTKLALWALVYDHMHWILIILQYKYKGYTVESTENSLKFEIVFKKIINYLKLLTILLKRQNNVCKESIWCEFPTFFYNFKCRLQLIMVKKDNNSFNECNMK